LYTGRALHLQDFPKRCEQNDGYPLPQDSIPLHMWVILLFALVPLAIGIEIMHLLDRYQAQPFTGWQRLLAWVLILISPPMWDSLIFYGHYEQPLALYFGLLAVRFFAERPRPGEQQRLPGWAKMAISGMLLGLALLCRTSASFTVIPLALVVLFDIVRDQGQRWQRLGEGLAWGSTLLATVVLILLPFYLHDRAHLTFSLLTFRARLGIGDGSLWTFAIGTPWELRVQALDSTVGLVLAVVLSVTALLLGRVRGRNDPALYAVICVATICFSLSIKAVWGYYFADPLVWALAWAATRQALRARWWEPIIATAFFAVVMIMTETRISIAPPGLPEAGWTRVIVLLESGAEFLGLFLVQLLLITLLALRRPAEMPQTMGELSALPVVNGWQAAESME
ncbi:MAG: phospholipid carrier-dependent glycosyltransferase, partial [Ktedonobacterales bacterium]|nr:phospholipid carrier-dependent glycosyltransferase [Ktedonobacterales bacterium]